MDITEHNASILLCITINFLVTLLPEEMLRIMLQILCQMDGKEFNIQMVLSRNREILLFGQLAVEDMVM